MYKTIGQMGCDNEIGNKPYHGGSLASLQSMMFKQYIDTIVNRIPSIPNSDYETDDTRYATLNGRRMITPMQNRRILGLPPITQEDILESPAESRIIGEDPYWIDALKSKTISHIAIYSGI